MAISRSWRNAKKQLTLQSQYDSEARKENYEYGEMAADSAHERSIALYDYQKEAESLANQIAEAKESGVNPAAIVQGYGGGSSGIGGGAQGGGARGVEGVDVAGILGAQNERKALSLEGIRVGAEVAKQRQEARQTKAETEKIKAETDKVKEETDTSKRLTPRQEKLIEQITEGHTIDNLRKRWENDNNVFTEKAGLEVLKLRAEIGGEEERTKATEAEKILTQTKTEGYWTELLNATKTADAAKINAAANKLSAEVADRAEGNPGGFTNVKTWKRLAEDTVDGVKDTFKDIKNTKGEAAKELLRSAILRKHK